MDNNFLEKYPVETRDFLADFGKKYNFNEICSSIESLSDLKVLIVGDGIIDEYHYCEPMGKSNKSNLVVNRYLDNEVFAGGAFAIANHVSGLCKHVQLVTLLGKENPRKDFILENLKPNIKTNFFFREDGPTIVKRRYIHQYTNQKLFEINFIDDRFINLALEKKIIDNLVPLVPQFDLVLVSDFGHGFITENIFRAIEGKAKVLAINTQTNGANAGYNLITKYFNPNYVCLDEPEVRLAAQKKHSDIEEIAQKIRKYLNANYLEVTLGKKGSIGVSSDGKINKTPVFCNNVLDTIGAGDAFFSFTAPCFAKGLSLDLVSFIGNAVGALAVQIVCNKKPVEKNDLFAFIKSLIK
jgi:bifunctional ADP-heptose synthase (sugar kinase/adenylyltransferase)